MSLLRLGDRKTLSSIWLTITLVLSCSDGSQLPCSEMPYGEAYVTRNQGFQATAQRPPVQPPAKNWILPATRDWVWKRFLPPLEPWDDHRQHLDYSLWGTLSHTQITDSETQHSICCIKLLNLGVICSAARDNTKLEKTMACPSFTPGVNILMESNMMLYVCRTISAVGTSWTRQHGMRRANLPLTWVPVSYFSLPSHK